MHGSPEIECWTACHQAGHSTTPLFRGLAGPAALPVLSQQSLPSWPLIRGMQMSCTLNSPSTVASTGSGCGPAAVQGSTYCDHWSSLGEHLLHSASFYNCRMDETSNTDIVSSSGWKASRAQWSCHGGKLPKTLKTFLSDFPAVPKLEVFCHRCASLKKRRGKFRRLCPCLDRVAIQRGLRYGGCS